VVKLDDDELGVPELENELEVPELEEAGLEDADEEDDELEEEQFLSNLLAAT
jgi:hypothetical protein